MSGLLTVMGNQFFAAWLVIAIIWLWGTLFIAGFYPPIDGRDQILAVWKGVRGGRKSQDSDGEGRGPAPTNAQTSPGDSVKGGSSVDVIQKTGA